MFNMSITHARRSVVHEVGAASIVRVVHLDVSVCRVVGVQRVQHVHLVVWRLLQHARVLVQHSRRRCEICNG